MGAQGLTSQNGGLRPGQSGWRHARTSTRCRTGGRSVSSLRSELPGALARPSCSRSVYLCMRQSTWVFGRSCARAEMMPNKIRYFGISLGTRSYGTPGTPGVSSPTPHRRGGTSTLLERASRFGCNVRDTLSSHHVLQLRPHILCLRQRFFFGAALWARRPL